MSRERLTVVVSQAQGRNPTKRSLEESVTAALLVEPGVEVRAIPSLIGHGDIHETFFTDVRAPASAATSSRCVSAFIGMTSSSPSTRP